MSFTNVTEFLDSLILRGIPGCECIVHKDGREIYRHAAGFADRENSIPAGKDAYGGAGAIVDLYSVTKVSTAAAGMQLIERGKMLPAEPLYYYIPEFANRNLKVRSGSGTVDCTRPIRVRDLFCMTAGFDYNVSTPGIKRVIEQTDGRAPTLDVVRALAEEPLSFQPGTLWQYSLCHDVLAALIEVVSDMPYPEYMRRNIFEPLGMEDTFFDIPEDKKYRHAPQYRFDEALGRAELTDSRNAFRLGTEYYSGGAGLLSTAADQIKLAAALANRGLGENGERILLPKTVDFMRGDCLNDSTRPAFVWQQHSGYGYGYGVRTLVAPHIGCSYSNIGEFGWGGAAGSLLIADPAANISIVYIQQMLNNMEEYIHPRLRNHIYQAIG